MTAPEARYYTALPDGFVQCELCPHHCRIADGRAGLCLGRVNQGGKLFAASYGLIVSAATDPIEKKPLYHFHPGARILSIATYGCNLACPFCQNSELSKRVQAGTEVAPGFVVHLAQRENSFGVAYTYTEPLVWYEFVLDSCRLMREAGLKNVLVTNGMLNEAPLRELLPFVDAMNIDLKGMRPEYYRDFLHGDLATVLNTIRIARMQCHVEITNLVVPGKNDSEAETAELVDFVASLGRDVPLHFSRYFPHYKLNLPPTPVATLMRAREIARAKLDYVYLGNVGGVDDDTHCPACGNLLVARQGFQATISGIKDKACDKCGKKADFVL